jgi:MerR family copper efflux transcriptional regulator
MQIGTLAQAVGLSTKTIRFYEQRGLLPAPPRTSGGFRDYPPETVDRLRFIRDAQSAGLSLADIGGILALRDSGHAPCAHVKILIAGRLEQIERRLADLRATRTALRDLTRRAAEVNPDTCAEADICTILASDPGRDWDPGDDDSRNPRVLAGGTP